MSIMTKAILTLIAIVLMVSGVIGLGISGYVLWLHKLPPLWFVLVSAVDTMFGDYLLYWLYAPVKAKA